MHSPSFLLRDIRNIKKNGTLNLPMTSKDLVQAKDVKKARSSEQLINLKGFVDTKKDKIKTIDQKLDFHQTQIQKNGVIIQQLTNNLFTLKSQFTIQKEKYETEEKKNKQMRQEIQTTNKLLKSKNFKIQELTKKIETIQKQLQVIKPCQIKVQQLTKTNNQLRKQMCKLQETLNEKKKGINEQNKQIEKYKDKLNQLGGIKAQIQKCKSNLKQKDQQISDLSSRIKYYQREKIYFNQKSQQITNNLTNQLKQINQKLKKKENILLQTKIQINKEIQKVEKLQKYNHKLKSQLLQKENSCQALRKQLKQVKQKFEQINSTIYKKQEQDKYQAQKIHTMKSKIDELQKNLEDEQNQTSKLRPFSTKIQNLQKKSKRLEELYNLMVPQIQCPYGHELKNPITVIPCGHNYCLGCKKGYTKQCMLCNGKLKIEAIYRNQLMDDIINIVTGIKQILQMIK